MSERLIVLGSIAKTNASQSYLFESQQLKWICEYFQYVHETYVQYVHGKLHFFLFNDMICA